MAFPSLLRTSARPELYVCIRCAFNASKTIQTPTRRWVGTKYIAKVVEAEREWQEQALRIKNKEQRSMLTILEERGLVHQVTGERDNVDAMMTANRVGAYVGIDPTGPSLHIGHMLPLMSLFWMYVHGYHTVTLLGGATAKIGDPTDRLETRESQHRTVRARNTVNMHFQLKSLWINAEAYGLKYGYKWNWAWKRALLNNNSWMNKLPIMEVLQIMGPGVRLGAMMAKDTVRNKMAKGDGMSFSEFTYPLLQAWDWWEMYDALGIRVQIGGSDQYGNITAGMDAVKYVAKNHPEKNTEGRPRKTTLDPFGFTTPLVTTSAGVKLGKSSGNAIYLDKDLTTCFDLYGHFLKISDQDVERYLKLFTFMPIPDIDVLVKEHMENPGQRKAQHKLAREFLELVHGAEEAAVTAEQHRLLYHKPASTSSQSPGEAVGIPALDLPHVSLNSRPKAQLKLPRSLITTKSIGKILYASGLAKSISDGHRLAEQQAVYVGGGAANKKEPMLDGSINWVAIKVWVVEDTQKFLLRALEEGENDLLLLRRGKNNIRVIEVVDDDVYEQSMARYPGDGKPDVPFNPATPSTPKTDRPKSTAALPATRSDSSGVAPDWQIETNRYERMTPTKRIRSLKEDFRKSEATYHRKQDKKNEPVGKFMGHGLPRGPVIGPDDGREPHNKARHSEKWMGRGSVAARQPTSSWPRKV